MKTAIKKLFSLMLVAVLLVSAVPVAFAAGTAPETIPCPKCGATAELVAENAVPATCTTAQRDIYHCPNEACDYYKDFYNNVADSALGHDWVAADCDTPKTCGTCGATEGGALGHAWVAADCDTPKTCSTCGATEDAALGHTPGAAATCTTAQTCTVCGEELAEALGHTEVTDAAVAATCTESGLTEGKHCSVCSAVIVAQETVDALGHNYVDGECSRCGKAEPVSTIDITFKNNLTGDEVVVTAEIGEKITLPTIEYVNGYSIQGWNFDGTIRSGKYTVKADSPTVVTAKYKKTAEDDKNVLNVYARLYTGDVLKETVLIHQNKQMMTNDAILEYLLHADTKAELSNTIKSDYPGYTYSYKFYNARGEEAATDNLITTDGAKNVYINLKSKAKQVLVYVHVTSRSDKYVRILELDGYKANETVSYDTVKSAVKKHYSFSDMAMFDQTGWNDYLDKKDATDTKHVVVGSGDVTKIHVRLYGVGSSSSATPDSSNPKTGDMIFNAVTIMGASAACLAALFFLNKKRAY